MGGKLFDRFTDKCMCNLIRTDVKTFGLLKFKNFYFLTIQTGTQKCIHSLLINIMYRFIHFFGPLCILNKERPT